MRRPHSRLVPAALASALAIATPSTRCAAAEDGATFAGSLGKLEIVACLGSTSGEDRYYDLKIGKTLTLRPHATADEVWVESEPSSFPAPDDEEAAQWQVRETDDAVVGSWQPGADGRQKGRPRLAIRLRRIASGCDEFERRRVKVPPRTVTGSPGTSPLVEWRRHGLADVVGLRLLGGSPPAALAAINRRLDEAYATAVSESFDCRDYTLAARVELFADLALVELAIDSYCGGAHPNEGYLLFAFDRQSGDLVSHAADSGDWFASLPEDLAHPQDELARLLARQVDPAECRDVLAPTSYWPTPEGVTFRLWTDTRSGAGCRQDAVIPYETARTVADPAAVPQLDLWHRRLAGQRPVVVSSN